MKAVITADIIDYSRLSREQSETILSVLSDLFDHVKKIRRNLEANFSIRRGDSIQGETEKPEDALRIALLIKAALNKINFGGSKRKTPEVDARIAIGIGPVEIERAEVNESSGTAYIRSGRTLDGMKKGKQQIAFRSGKPDWDAELETELKLLEGVISGWKQTSAEVIYWTLTGHSEKEISSILKISQSAVNQRKKTAGWSGIEALLKRYRELINKEDAG